MKTNLLLSTLMLSLLVFPLGCGPSPSVNTPSPIKTTIGNGPDQPAPAPAVPSGQTPAVAAKPAIEPVEPVPADVPVPPQTKLTFSSKNAKMTTFQFETVAPVPDVISFYSSTLAHSGWQIQATTRAKSGAVIGATKAKRTLTVIVGKIGQTTHITLDVGKP
jgi:hypothetical protein